MTGAARAAVRSAPSGARGSSELPPFASGLAVG
jgi:hypothetical protein